MPKKDTDNKRSFSDEIKRSSKRQESVKKQLTDRKRTHEAEAKKREKQARGEAEKEVQKEIAKKGHQKQWRKREVVRKQEIAEMQRKKEAERQRLEEKKREKAEYKKQHEEYMKTMKWTSKMQHAKERRKKLARDSKLLAIKTAESEHQQRHLHVQQDQKVQEHAIAQLSRKERGDLDGEENQLYLEIEDDIREERRKLYAKEQMEKSRLEQDISRQQYKLKGITDPSLLRRTKDELGRNAKAARRRLQTRYQKMKTDIEVARNQRRDSIKRMGKKNREDVSEAERQTFSKVKHEAYVHDKESAMQMHGDIEEAKDLEKDIMAMKLSDALGIKLDKEDE